MPDVDIVRGSAPGRLRTTSKKTRLLESTSVAAVDIASARTRTAADAKARVYAAGQADDVKSPAQKSYELNLKERGIVNVPGRRSRKDLRTIVRKKPRQRFRGVPPPLTFDIDALPDSTRLTETEAAAALRRSKSALENWRQQPGHPLKWRRVAGRIVYELPSIREVLKGDKT
jgi:hypothetical protein